VGAFVTIFRGESLRGCLGNAEGREPLYLAVPRLARAAVSRDYRFDPIRPEELPGIRVELSLLGDLTPLPGLQRVLLAELDPMRCGVYLLAHGRTGLLLPQVARRLGWSARELLEQVCSKAGLPPDAWRESEARIFGFTAHSRDLLGTGEFPRLSDGGEP
jgi:AmmeMemoRadiSam system protein A